MFKGITDVFFDLDHTLWDFERNSALAFEKILGEHQIDLELSGFLEVYVPANFEFWKLYREERITKEALRYQRLKTVFDKLGHQVSDVTIHSLSKAYIDHLPFYNNLFPHTLEILEYLKPKYRLHIITNGFHEIQERKLKNSGIFSFFQHIVNSEMAGVKKPDPLIFELALEKSKTAPEKSIMIGDCLEADILGAQGVGLNTLHFNAHNGPEHDHCPMIKELREIKRYL